MAVLEASGLSVPLGDSLLRCKPSATTDKDNSYLARAAEISNVSVLNAIWSNVSKLLRNLPIWACPADSYHDVCYQCWCLPDAHIAYSGWVWDGSQLHQNANSPDCVQEVFLLIWLLYPQLKYPRGIFWIFPTWLCLDLCLTMFYRKLSYQQAD